MLFNVTLARRQLWTRVVWSRVDVVVAEPLCVILSGFDRMAAFSPMSQSTPYTWATETVLQLCATLA